MKIPSNIKIVVLTSLVWLYVIGVGILAFTYSRNQYRQGMLEGLKQAKVLSATSSK